MLVQKHHFNSILEKIKNHKIVSLDCEATGLHPYQKDRLFSIIISTIENDYYFNFNKLPDHLGNLPEEKYILPFEKIPTR